jgi:hypothetical protein
MHARVSAARRRVFFAALEATGNHRIAAARARVTYAWVKLHKRDDPAFRAACEAAVVAAGERLRAMGRSAKLPPGLCALAGEELVMRIGPAGRPILTRARSREWSASAEQLFLETLAATCNVTRAAQAAGMSFASAYRHRQRSDRFDARWRAALEEGYVDLECTLLAAAHGSLTPDPTRPGAHAGAHDWDEAKNLLTLHRHSVTGRGKPTRTILPRATEEETNRALERALGMIERRRARAAARAAAEGNVNSA